MTGFKNPFITNFERRKEKWRFKEEKIGKKKEESIAKWSKEKIFETYIKLNNKHGKCTFERNWKKEISK